MRDVYGESVDKIVQGNTSNIVFLKSTDDSMLDTLQKMSGTTHKAFRETIAVDEDNSKLFWRRSPQAHITLGLKELPVVSYNDMAFISERNSIVFRAGDSPIWNRNQTILPMSWRLFQNTIVQPGKEYSLQTIPTLSSALDFDVRKNQPDFLAMWEHRRRLAKMSSIAQEKYQKAYGLTDFELAQLDQDDLADELMEIIEQMASDVEKEGNAPSAKSAAPAAHAASPKSYEDNLEISSYIAEAEKKGGEDAMKKRYAGGALSRDNLVSLIEGVSRAYDREFIQVYLDIRSDLEKDDRYFRVGPDGSLCGRDGTQFIYPRSEEELKAELATVNKAGKSVDSKVYNPDGDVLFSDLNNFARFCVTEAFYRFLVEFEDWDDIAGGRFEQAMASIMMSD